MSRIKILIDSNIYLRFFDSNQKGFKKLLDQLLQVEEDIFVTRQIVDEVERNKLNVFHKSISNYKSKIEIDSILLPEHFASGYNNHDILDWNCKRQEIEKVNSQLSKDLEKIFIESLEKISASSDYVSSKLKVLFKNQIRESTEEYLNAKRRKETGNPPGKNNDSLGDQITWEQFLNKALDISETWIISNDRDYFTKYNNSIFLNPFLHAELLRKRPNLKINCFTTLSDGLKSYFQTNPKENSISAEELEIINQEEKLLNRTPTTSSNIASIGYESDSQTLEIEFLNGGVYQYFDVPQHIYRDLMDANSIGQYHAQNIKGVYRYSKV